MTTLIHDLDRDRVNSLGIPVDNLSRDDALARILRLAKQRDGRPRLVSTLNVDFLVNALGTGLSRARHPELLEVLRNSDLVTADGFPILWLSRLAGRPLRQRVCGSDLVPQLAALAAEEGLSLFLLGGGDGVAARAAETLVDGNPGLQIAGTAAPMIHAAGPGLADAEGADEALVASINESGADILLLGLGNPKQELWFNRNRHRLKVPVSIGVGGTFEFIIGTVRRAPAWMQRGNLEWVYRVSQDPGRLWRRYALGLVKLAALSAPLAWTRIRQGAAFRLQGGDVPQLPRWRHLWSSRDASLAVVRLPALVGPEYLDRLVRDALQADSPITQRLLDFSRVSHVDFRAHHALFTLAELQRTGDGGLLLLGLSERLRRRLAAARVLDVLQTAEGDPLDRFDIGGDRAELGCRSYTLEDTALVFLSGRVDGQGLARIGFRESVEHATAHRCVVIDMRKVSLLESSAIVVFRELFSGPDGAGRPVFLSGVNANVRQMFRMADLGAPSSVLSDRQLLETISGEVGGRD